LPTSSLRPLTFLFTHDPAPSELYTLSLHDALPISSARTATTTPSSSSAARRRATWITAPEETPANTPSCSTSAWRPATASALETDRKSTRLNSSHVSISYAVFCLKKKKKQHKHTCI